MSDRLPCCVFGCRRTFKAGSFEEIMCGPHYRLADKALRALRAQLKRRAKRHGWTERFIRIDDWLWERIKRQATDRSMGL